MHGYQIMCKPVQGISREGTSKTLWESVKGVEVEPDPRVYFIEGLAIVSKRGCSIRSRDIKECGPEEFKVTGLKSGDSGKST